MRAIFLLFEIAAVLALLGWIFYLIFSLFKKRFNRPPETVESETETNDDPSQPPR